MQFAHVLVVGAGQMGGGIAQVVATSGRRVSLHDELSSAVEKALETMQRSLERLAEKGGAEPTSVLERVEVVSDLVPADLLIEAVIEDADAKKSVFRRADEVLPREAFEHLFDTDHLARGGYRPAGEGDRDALLQPRAGPEVGRGDPCRRDVGRDSSRNRSARRGARQGSR